MHTKGGSPVAFVEYQDVRYAAQAMATLQGSFLLSSDRGAIRIEYAKSKMAEVGFTNLWIEVGFTLCYDRVVDAGAALRERSASSSSRSSLAGVVVCSYRAHARRAEVTRGSPESKRRRDGGAQRCFFFAYVAWFAHRRECLLRGRARSLRTSGLRTPRALAYT